MDPKLTKPLVSVVMPMYNAALYVSEAIASLQSQTYEHWELIVVNDGSTDKSADIVRSFHDPRIRLIDNHDNAGSISKRLNEGLAEAQGEFLARLDSDDLWSDHDKLRKQVAVMVKDPDLG